ncbi:hypothetical protein TNIN_277601 [Trichonephila inaurata madagascariensis]|uniref:Uncharacterized protein n=1 Tax=Trichonephila inaurata madagascariensis TaxID=2747483 RepID=A0A8X6YAW0_9ARAC|nr:hypothetical protein TNIN_277601 [Trichonephila inaurata madagascariensis]
MNRIPEAGTGPVIIRFHRRDCSDVYNYRGRCTSASASIPNAPQESLRYVVEFFFHKQTHYLYGRKNSRKRDGDARVSASRCGRRISFKHTNPKALQLTPLIYFRNPEGFITRLPKVSLRLIIPPPASKTTHQDSNPAVISPHILWVKCRFDQERVGNKFLKSTPSLNVSTAICSGDFADEYLAAFLRSTGALLAAKK